MNRGLHIEPLGNALLNETRVSHGVSDRGSEANAAALIGWKPKSLICERRIGEHVLEDGWCVRIGVADRHIYAVEHQTCCPRSTDHATADNRNRLLLPGSRNRALSHVW